METQEGGDIAVTVNHAVAEHYLAALHELADKYGLRDDVSVMSLAKLPDVLGSERIEQDADEMTRDVLSVFGEACDISTKCVPARVLKLAEDVRNRASEIERMVGEVEVRSPERVREYREKLLARMKECWRIRPSTRPASSPRRPSTRTRPPWTRKPCVCAAICSSWTAC